MWITRKAMIKKQLAMSLFRSILLFLVIASLCQCAMDKTSELDYSIPDQFTEANLNVLVFFIEDCPVCFSAARVIQDIQSEHPEIDIHWIYATAFPDYAELRFFLRDYNITQPISYDTSLTLARSLDVDITPEVLLVSDNGELIYRGLVDDYFVEFGKHKNEAQKHFLKDAIDSYLANEPIITTRTTPIGCFIESEKVNTR